MSTVDRERILRHPDLRARLTQPPLNYERPEQWTGYIAPDTYGQQLNTCPRRAALMELAEEAHQRELRAGTAPIPTLETEQDTHA